MPGHNRWAALLVLCVGTLMVILDSAIVNVALPSIQADLGFSQSSLTWVVNAYLIPFGGLLLLAGRLGDLIGRKRIFVLGLALFTAASLLCGLARSPEVLIAARFLQGVGGALTSAVILGMIVTLFPRPAEQARAIGIYSFVAAGGASIGLIAGGLLTQALSWHWIFFVNLPIGLAAAFAATRVLEREDGIGWARGADIPGALLIVSALMLGVYTIVEASEFSLPLGVLALALLCGFILREARADNPLVPLGTFRSRSLTGANVVQALMVAGLFGMFFLGSLYLQRVLGFDALRVGAAFLPVSIGIGAFSVGVSARVVVRFGPQAPLLLGLTLVAAGLLWLVRVPVDGDYVRDMLPSMVVFGIGAGLAFPALMTLAMHGISSDDSGLASGLTNTAQQVGAALGLAVLATLSSTRTTGMLELGTPLSAALTDGYRLSFGIGAGSVVLGAALTLVLLRRLRSVDPIDHDLVARHGLKSGADGQLDGAFATHEQRTKSPRFDAPQHVGDAVALTHVHDVERYAHEPHVNTATRLQDEAAACR